MGTYRKVLVILTTVATLVMLFGCAGSQKQSYSGFLDDYSQLKKGPDDIDLRYMKAGVDFSKYNKVMLDEVAFFLSPESKYKGLKASEVKELSDAFYEIYIKTLGDIFTDKPGPNVARLRLALTNIERSNPVSGTMTSAPWSPHCSTHSPHPLQRSETKMENTPPSPGFFFSIDL